jgi:hypothetical protein
MLGRIPVSVKMYSATEDHTIHSHQVHAADGEQLKQRRVCAKEGFSDGVPVTRPRFRSRRSRIPMRPTTARR